MMGALMLALGKARLALVRAAAGLVGYLLFWYRKSRSHVHFSTGPGVPRPPHRELSIECKIFFCHKIGRTGRHRPKGEASS